MIVSAIDWAKWSAIGTILAAGATVFLGVVTRSLVKATKEIVGGSKDEAAATKVLAEATRGQAVLAARALSLQVEPRIVPVHEAVPRFVQSENIGGSHAVHWVNPLLVEVENVGAGIAQLVRVELTVSSWGAPDVLFPGVVRPGAKAQLRAEFTTPPPGDTAPPPATIPPGHDVYIRVHYRGAGDREFQIAFAWTRPAGSEARWRLTLNEDLGHTEL